VNKELKIILKEAVMAYFKVMCEHLDLRTEAGLNTVSG
jgi:hypothetical protein